MAAELPPRLTNLYEKAINTSLKFPPDRMRKIVQKMRPYITLEPKTFLTIPGLDKGIIFNHLKPNLVPTPQLADSILFAGQHSYEGLRDYAFNQLTVLDADYLTHSSLVDGEYSLRSSPINIPAIKRNFEVVEKAMLKSKSRYTGEPAPAHILRGMLRVSDIIHRNIKYRYEGQYSSLFTSRIAQVYLHGIIDHDFTEDHSVLDPSQPLGIIYPNHPVPLMGDNPEGLFIQASDDSDNRGKIEIDEEYEYHFRVAMRAMNRNNVSDENAIKHLLSTVNRSQ